MTYRCPNCRAVLYSQGLGYCPECRVGFWAALEGDAHFSLVTTQFDNMELLTQALEELNLDLRRNFYVRGDGGRTIAEVVVVLEDGCDLGYFFDNGKIIFVADLFCLNKNVKATQLIQKIHSKYLDLLAKQGEQ